MDIHFTANQKNNRSTCLATPEDSYDSIRLKTRVDTSNKLTITDFPTPNRVFKSPTPSTYPCHLLFSFALIPLTQRKPYWWIANQLTNWFPLPLLCLSSCTGRDDATVPADRASRTSPCKKQTCFQDDDTFPMRTLSAIGDDEYSPSHDFQYQYQLTAEDRS